MTEIKFKITETTSNETFTTINDIRVLIDKMKGTSNTLDYYMIYCKNGNDGRGIYTLCGDITVYSATIISTYQSNKKLLNNSLMLRGYIDNNNIDGAFYKALENIVTLFKFEYGLK